MKRMLKIFTLILSVLFVSVLFAPIVFGQDGTPTETNWILELLKTTLGTYVVTFLAFITAVTTLTSLIAKWIKKEGWFKQKLSWFVAVVAGLVAWALNLGIFDPLTWWEAILTGFCGGLVANGVFDIPMIQSILAGLGLELPINERKRY